MPGLRLGFQSRHHRIGRYGSSSYPADTNYHSFATAGGAMTSSHQPKICIKEKKSEMNKSLVLFCAGWMDRMKLSQEEPPLKALRTSQVELQSGTSCRRHPPTCSKSSRKLFKKALSLDAPLTWVSPTSYQTVKVPCSRAQQGTEGVLVWPGTAQYYQFSTSYAISPRPVRFSTISCTANLAQPTPCWGWGFRAGKTITLLMSERVAFQSHESFFSLEVKRFFLTVLILYNYLCVASYVSILPCLCFPMYVGMN